MPHTCSAEAFSCKPNIFRIKRTRFAFSAATSSITDVLPVALAIPASSRYTSSLGTRSMAAIAVNASSRSIKECCYFLPHAPLLCGEPAVIACGGAVHRLQEPWQGTPPAPRYQASLLALLFSAPQTWNSRAPSALPRGLFFQEQWLK